MSEKRTPDIIMLLRKKGKPNAKIELFHARQFPIGFSNRVKNMPCNRYRVRVDGKWYRRRNEQYTFLTKWEFRDLLWKSFKF